MTLRIFGIDLTFSFWFFAVILAVLLTGREVLAFYMLLPVAVHECGHLLAMALFGIRIESVSFTAFSIDIRRDKWATASYGRDIAAALGGVAANLLFALALYLFAFKSMRVMLLISVNLALAAFNLMPVGSLDGGQAFRLLLERRGSPARAYRVSRACSFLLLAPLFAFSILLLLRGIANLSLLLACLYLAGTVIFAEG